MLSDSRYFWICIALLLLMSNVVLAAFPAPGVWRGEMAGRVQGRSFRVPVTVELGAPLPHEHNPLHLSITGGDQKQIGSVSIASALQFNTSTGRATLQYFAIHVNGDRLQARLTDSHTGEAAAANGFTGPNVSALEASELMKDVLSEAWGDSELFSMSKGGVMLDTNGNRMTGRVSATGFSPSGTSHNVRYEGQLNAVRIR